MAGLPGSAIASAGDEQNDVVVAADVSQQAYWSSAIVDALPSTLADEFPPGVACVLAPELCTEQAELVTDPIEQLLHGALELARNVRPPSAVMIPGALPVGRFAGNGRFASAITFELPTGPDGQTLDHFELRLAELPITYAISSPAFRQAVLALMLAIDEGADDPQAALEALTTELLKVVEDPEAHPLLERGTLPLEACPVLEPFSSGVNQAWDDLPEVDCILGTNGVRGDDGIWTFDLTLAAQEWADGMLDNHGVLLRPHAAEYLAFGDPDLSDFAFVALDGDGLIATPELTAAFAPEPETSNGLPPAPPPTEGAPRAQQVIAVPTGPGTSFLQPDFDDAPIREEPVDVALPPSSDPDSTIAMVPVQSVHPSTPWYGWLALLTGLAGLLLLGRGLVAQPQVVAEREGAMTRLIERQRRLQS